MKIEERRYGGPVQSLYITLDDGTFIEVHADTFSMGHGETSTGLSYSVSDPSDRL